MARFADSNLAQLAMAAFLAVLMPCALLAARPRDLVLYSHESRVPPTQTIIDSARPSGDPTALDEFGLIRTISNVLRDGTDSSATILGSQVGTVVVGKDTQNVYIAYTYFMNMNSTYSGTIAVHGHIDGTSQVDRVFAVVGGTGDFVFVTGIDTSAFDSQNQQDLANIVNLHTLSLRYMDS